MLISLSKSQMCSKNDHFAILAYLVAILVTRATVKVKLIPDFYTWAFVLTNQYEEIDEKQLLFFGLKARSSLPYTTSTFILSR